MISRNKELTHSTYELLAATERSFVLCSREQAKSKADQLITGNLAVSMSDPQAEPRTDIATLRGHADLVTVLRLYHDADLHRRLYPIENTARLAFDAAERARVQGLGVSYWPGMRANLSAKFMSDCLKFLEDEYFSERAQSKLSFAFSLVISEEVGGLMIPRSARLRVENEISLVRRLTGQFRDAAQLIGNQFSYACAVHGLLENIGLIRSRMTDLELRKRVADVREEFDPSQLMKRQKIQKEDPTQSEKSEVGLDTRSFGKSGEGKGEGRAFPHGQGKQLYRAYTREYDEIIDAANLASATELSVLRKKLEDCLSEYGSKIGALAHRLQRRLLVMQSRHWDFEQEEGILDVARITRIITDPIWPTSFKTERESELGSIVVSILLDNSASMKGEPIMIAACCADILARTLERCEVKLEVLGFTTVGWNGGQSRQLWASSNREASPGRLNDLRHIVYKSADQRWRQRKSAFALMLKEDILKENIDNEAVAWAYSRLLERGEKRKILIVVSDGAPADHSTLSLNHRDYLSDALREIVARIEQERAIELIAIGIRHDVGQFYSRAVRIDRVSSLASTLGVELVKLLQHHGSR